MIARNVCRASTTGPFRAVWARDRHRRIDRNRDQEIYVTSDARRLGVTQVACGLQSDVA